ncbi:MAG: 50S ribosomal protein L11 [Candidatus Magasanikbacteria bacterium]|uniref:Large ribosomal subunit protein uL11 n=1 Tax=Candidatus Magasanikbacteria bacterium CG10_big_fil_rev_8_21_14_0_10_38_6 TaxID=1974647 RepID=A0A2M6P1L1_9BACT|nr:50S ribosomal protein L11 [Candidatus Magasanikbacteria bacterium]NCS72019.1 50S ribosomal protein L11 [Candidatus Magasanikbacteria bacterium]PIR77623.1 MAG: 50S ribosomal protein L11 [Candidatus Magasanikbacteria bacterium CG10_big_fil_rev_8_21_14_0_10_38_6]
MAKKLLTQIKLQITGGAANPAPPVGPALGQHGLNIQDFCTQFNNATADKRGEVVPVIINVYEDRTFDFITKVAPASTLIMKAAGIKKGAGNPHKDKVGSITKTQLKEIAEQKMADLNANDIDAAMNIIAGTARQMGVEITE